MAKKKSADSKKKGTKKSKKDTWWRKTLRIIGKTLLVLFLFSLFITILYRWVNPPITPLMLSRKVFDKEEINYKWTNIEDISPYLIRAAIASEDGHFLTHHGIDFGAIKKARAANKKGKKMRGGSTISQQVAKNVFLYQKRSYVRKGLEAYFTFLIECFWGKKRIMEVYLNVIEMGHGVYGCGEASRRYFHTTPAKLSKDQAAALTSIYPSPRKWKPRVGDRKAARVLHNMRYIGKVKWE